MTEKFNIASFIDHTILKPETTSKEISNLCSEAQDFNFISVCVNPCWVEMAVKELQSSNVKVCTVVGFPLGANTATIKISEAREALLNGASEIDTVINIGRVKMRDEQYLLEELQSLSETCKSHDALLKVILETALLTTEEKEFAALTAIKAGADFVKTSTGFASGGATIEDVALLRRLAGENKGVKASGGIRSLSDALKMIEAGANRIGTSAGVAIIKEHLTRGDLVGGPS